MSLNRLYFCTGGSVTACFAGKMVLSPGGCASMVDATRFTRLALRRVPKAAVDWHCLETLLLCGTGEYDIADFRANHIVNGSSLEFRRVLEWFWAAVSNFTVEEMARLLQFTTGCSQLPPGGFQELTPKFTLTAAPTFGNLPTAHTCFNQLCLPDYDSYEQFEKALLLAIKEGTEGFGFI